MANYGNYKKVIPDQFEDGSLTADKLAPKSTNQYCIFYVYNNRGFTRQSCSNGSDCICQACGASCTWTVPANVSKAIFEIWSGGGGGPGINCCGTCSFAIGGAGGNYALKSISVTPGDTYTICAGGSWNCARAYGCSASMGCASYVTGNNLSNFCAQGACGGWMCNGDAWGPRTHGTCTNCGVAGSVCGFTGADFGINGTVGWKMGHSGCHCQGADLQFSGTAPLIGKAVSNSPTEVWCSCGCYINWPSGGGMPGVSSYCGNYAQCCAAGSGQGGSGIVKITFA